MNKARNVVRRRSGWVGAVAAAATLSVIAVAAAAPIARLAGAATVTTHQTKRGKDLAGSSGHALYLFAHDKGTKSSCYGSCAKAWPPLLTKGAPVAGKGSGVNSTLLGTTKRTGGTVQVTYHGHPLYEYAKDTKPGQINGEGANQFGGHWYLVNTSGNAVKPSGGGSVCDPLCPGY